MAYRALSEEKDAQKRNTMLRGNTWKGSEGTRKLRVKEGNRKNKLEWINGGEMSRRRQGV